MMTPDQFYTVISVLEFRHSESAPRMDPAGPTRNQAAYIEMIAHEYAHLLAFKEQVPFSDYKYEHFTDLSSMVHARVLDLGESAQDHNEILTNAIVQVALDGWIPMYTIEMIASNAQANLSKRYTEEEVYAMILKHTATKSVRRKAHVLRCMLLEENDQDD